MNYMEQPAQILFPTNEIEGSISIMYTLRTDTSKHTDPTIQPTRLHLKQANGPVHSELNHFLIRILNSGIDVTSSGRNIDNPTRMNPQGTIVTTIPESNRANTETSSTWSAGHQFLTTGSLCVTAQFKVKVET